ncbi:MAG: hypothetical protein EHM46_04045, partial [Bacteroidetes bacterium]
MNSIMIRLITIAFAALILPPDLGGQIQSPSQVKVLSLEEVIGLAREQSLMALMSRHQFRGSYWEYRTHQARFRPGLTLQATLPSLRNTMESVTQPDGSEKFVTRSTMQNALDLQLSQNIGVTGGRVFVSSELQRTDNFDQADPVSYLAYPVTVGFVQPLSGYNSLRWDRKIEPMKYDEAKRDYINAMERVSQRAVGYFFDLALAQINLEIARKNYANNDTLFQIAQGRYQLGT